MEQALNAKVVMALACQDFVTKAKMLYYSDLIFIKPSSCLLSALLTTTTALITLSQRAFHGTGDQEKHLAPLDCLLPSWPTI